MAQPLFLRTMKHKNAQEVLKLFEQFRKNLKLNRSFKNMDGSERSATLKVMKKDFYDGLIADLMQKEAYKLAEVIYNEKKREKFEVFREDWTVGLKIFSE